MDREPWVWRHAPFIIVGVVVGIATPLIWYARTHPEPPPPCERFADLPMKDVPARCVRYFQEER